MILASNVLPDNAGYVAAAYIVFVALLLIYVGIMAYKLGKVERDVVELNELADRRLDEAAGPTAPREETPV
ncbi:MAG: hypothetical protein QOF86_2094 [Baekduia sp.]|jgi:hypothetical protein|nr:hypothetical protein [Baekduia sp.]